MNATLLYRTTAVLLVLFAIGHTAGFVLFRPATPEGVAVLDAMDHVHFPIGSANYSYGQFFRGFGFFASLYLLFAAYLAWHLGSLARTNPKAIGALAWVFCALQAASIALSGIYFLSPPVVFSVLTTICSGAAAGLVWTRQ
jgi:hypothetical protein